MRTVLSNVAVASAVGLVAACSVLNSFEDVKPESEQTGGRTGNSGGGTGDGGDSSASGGSSGSGGSGGSGGDSSGGVGGEASTGGETGTGGAPIEDAGKDAFTPGGPGGAIVAYADKKLVVLNPVDGAPLSSEDMGTVRGIANDVRTDLWYIFEQTGTPSEPLTLHVRELRIADGKWREIGTATGAPYPFSRVFPMNGRLAYLSTPTPNSPAAEGATLTVLNVEDPARILPVGTPHRPLPAGVKQGLLAAPTQAVGGVINVGILSSACAASTDGGTPLCDASLVSYSVTSAGIAERTTKIVGRALASGNFALALDPRGPSAVVGIPADNPPAQPGGCTQTTVDQGSVFKLNMNSLEGVGSPVPVPTNSQRFAASAAYDFCFDSAFFTTLVADTAIWSVPLAGGTVDKQCQSAGSGSVVLEPYTRTLIRPVQGPSEFYSIAGTAAAPRVTVKSLPQLPQNFIPTLVAVRDVDRNRTPCP